MIAKQIVKALTFVLPLTFGIGHAQLPQVNVTGIPSSFNMSSINCAQVPGQQTFQTLYPECLGGIEYALAPLLAAFAGTTPFTVASQLQVEFLGQYVNARVIAPTKTQASQSFKSTALELAIAIVSEVGENTTACVTPDGSGITIAVQWAEATETLSETEWPSIKTNAYPNGTSDASAVLDACKGSDIRVLPLEV